LLKQDFAIPTQRGKLKVQAGSVMTLPFPICITIYCMCVIHPEWYATVMSGENLEPEKALITKPNLSKNILYFSQIIEFENHTESI
jgi:hypothetical protein